MLEERLVEYQLQQLEYLLLFIHVCSEAAYEKKLDPHLALSSQCPALVLGTQYTCVAFIFNFITL